MKKIKKGFIWFTVMSLLSLSNLIVTNDAYALAKNGLRSQVALNITTASVNTPNDTDVVPLAMSLQEKIETYDLAAIETSGLIFSDTLEFTDWDEITGEEFTVFVTVNASGQITYVNDGAHSPQQIDAFKKKKRKRPASVPTKTNGGFDAKDFITDHAYNKHKYDPSIKSTSSKTQYGKNVNVKKLREITMNEADDVKKVRSTKYNVTFYYKSFKNNISTSDTPTDQHVVIINNSVPDRSTQYPMF
ncbi:hypothetical protein POF51_27540 [Brevibacillus sp. AG]|uniref:hypothetical protein n=1 Tax=Brevibacillus sp. AG TaxID=3020891 RepID=UPI00232B30F8|nr:hypothetical protein [Brevibacillus sp. AG]MDC0764482.1 hypothetical protein [Brevibacillus sp. AG]